MPEGLTQSEMHAWREVKEGWNGAQLCFCRGVFVFGCGCVLVSGFLLDAVDDALMFICEKSGNSPQPFEEFVHLRLRRDFLGEFAFTGHLVIFWYCLGLKPIFGCR